MKQFPLSLAAIALLLGFSACRDNAVDQPADAFTNTVFVANEGAFVGGAGDVTAYNTGSKELTKNVFQKANQVPAGNVLQNILVDGDRTFLVVNGGGSVIMCKTSDLSVIARFNDLGSPRHIEKVGKDKYYVSDWANSGIHVLNAETKTVGKLIATGQGPEDILYSEGFAYVCNSGGFTSDSTIAVIDVNTDVVVEVIQVGYNPYSLALDKNGYLWYLASGIPDYTNPTNNTPASIGRLLLTDSIRAEVRRIEFSDILPKPSRMSINGAGDRLYFLGDYIGDLYKMSIQDTVLPSNPFAEGNFYSLGVDPINDEIYVGDPKNFTQNGEVFRYSSSGSTLDQFTVGVIPGSFGFN